MNNRVAAIARCKVLARKINLQTVNGFALPIVSFIVLAVACRDTDYADGRAVAQLLSGQYYREFIAFSVALLAFFAVRRRSLRPVLGCVLLSASCLVLTSALKYSLHLGRPPHVTHGVIVPGFSPGFPSAHTAFAFGLAWLLTARLHRLSWLWFGFAVAVGWSRVELQSHYPYQVLAGALLGLALGWWSEKRQATLFPRLPLCPVS
jgi:membrane-associated phospholipid phosphatase